MKAKLIGITIVLFLLAAITTSVIIFCQNEKEQSKVYDGSLNNLTMQSIQIEETGRSMLSEFEGEVYYDVTVPDFTEIYCKVAQKAKSRDDVFKLIGEIIEKGNYSTVTHKMTAKLTVENGIETIHLDDAKNKLLENVLIEAVNKAMEVR
ncbi:MAG: hypothetical protein II998_02805 [Clostridia bacterium]|nr:hypothetical protein [Clostridia bacterium]